MEVQVMTNVLAKNDAIAETLQEQFKEKRILVMNLLGSPGVSSGKGGYVPCTPKACMAIVDHYGIELAGKKVVVLGRSQVVGKPVALLALERNATVTICHSNTQNLAAELAQADVVIAAVGKAHMVHGSMLKEGCVVIDVGINDLEGQTVGDVDFASASEVASAITPVPGGVGSVTTTMMLEGLYEAYYARNGHR